MSLVYTLQPCQRKLAILTLAVEYYICFSLLLLASTPPSWLFSSTNMSTTTTILSPFAMAHPVNTNINLDPPVVVPLHIPVQQQSNPPQVKYRHLKGFDQQQPFSEPTKLAKREGLIFDRLKSVLENIKNSLSLTNQDPLLQLITAPKSKKS